MRLVAMLVAAPVLLAGCVQQGPDVTNQVCDAGESIIGFDSDGGLICGSPSWDDLEDVPATVADGVDRDALADLSCRNGEIAQRSGGQWQCATPPQGATQKITRLVYSGAYIDDEADLDWRQLADVGTFRKDVGDTVLMVHWNGNAKVDAAGGIGTCVYQLRIDGLNSLGSASETTVSGAVAIIGETDGSIPFQVTDVFSSVGAGTHEVTIWVRGTPTECFLNPGNFKHTIIIEEKAV